MDMTALIVVVVGLLGVAVGTILIPWIAKKLSPEAKLALATVAEVAVYAAEKIFGRGFGEQKLTAAVRKVDEWLNKVGLDIDDVAVYNAIIEAWQKLNQSQIESGVKEDPEAEVQE